MTREQLLQRIAELDKEIETALRQAKAPTLDARKQRFPSTNIIGGILFLLAWVFSAPLVGQIVQVPEWWRWAELIFLIGGVLLLVGGVLQVLFWLFRRKKPAIPAEYQDATQRARELRARREELQKQLKDMD